HATGSYPGTWREDRQIIDEEYKEGIFVGYRWMDKKKEKGKVKSEKKNKGGAPLFAFGHGLSYTTFQLGKLTADKREMTAD
ncbi:hypothetical protein ELE67_29590, partial [Klebsiella pneumoniae]|nr:hypothetical protein [Klebsiella pneumoniae]